MKSQAEIAGHLTRGSSAHPQKGTVLHDPELLLADGSRRLLSVVRGRSNLVMIFTAEQDLSAFAASLAGNSHVLDENNARVLVIAPAADVPGTSSSPAHGSESSSAVSSHATTSQAAPSRAAELHVIALDPDGKIHRLLGASDAAGNLIPSIYVTDRFGEVFAAFQNPNPATLPSAAEIIRWLEFINQQCEECSPPEWPE